MNDFPIIYCNGKMISIDFQGGAHGNFLEFVCNKMAGVVANQLPFNQQGAAHNKQYRSDKMFFADHYSFNQHAFKGNRVVAIKIHKDDLLPLSQISLLRAGDYGLDNNELHLNTFHKFNNKDYRWVLETIIEGFFANQIKISYSNVKDTSWPDIETLQDFENLPMHIKQECIEMHNLTLLELNAENPNCPKHVLREFFEIGFLYPEQHGFLQRQQQMLYANDMDVFDFPFHSFYCTDLFIEQTKKIAHWANIVYNDWQSLVSLHHEFLERQPYKNSKLKCDDIVQQIINGHLPPSVNLIEESYINAMLTKQGYERRY